VLEEGRSQVRAGCKGWLEGLREHRRRVSPRMITFLKKATGTGKEKY